MTGRIYHPEKKHPQPYEDDLNPEASAGVNRAEVGHPRPPRTAYDMKEMHTYLADFSTDELKQIRILDEGTRLETGATYTNLAEEQPREIHAQGDEHIQPQQLYVAKKDVPFEIWNRLIGIQDPSRTKQQ